MGAYVLVCGKVFDGLSDALTGPAEILVEDNRIARIARSMGRPPGARVIDLSGPRPASSPTSSPFPAIRSTISAPPPRWIS